MKGALVGSLIAEVEREPLGVGDLAGDGVETECFERDSAFAEPLVLGHRLDERFFGRRSGPVLVTKAGEEFVELELGFRGKDPESARGREAVTDVVARGGGFTGFRFGTGGELRIRTVRGDLR